MAFVGPISENIDDAQSAGMRVAGGGQVLSFDEIDNLTAESGKPAETLMNLVALVARRFQTDVCSAYLLEPDRANLVLAAMLGLRLSCVGHLRMALNEGLAGLVAEQVSPVAVEQVNRHPRFKYFSEAGEEPYQSFLGVPLIDRGVLQVYSWCRRSRRASFGETRFACWFKPPGKWRRLSARRVRWIASSLQHKSGFGPWRAIYGGAGIMIPPACTLVAAQSESHLSSCGNSVCRHRTERARDGPAGSHQLCLSAPARVPGGGLRLGRAARRRLADAAGRLFFGGVRIARVYAHLFGRIGRAGRRPHQERVGFRHSPHRHRMEDEGLDFDRAATRVAREVVFTTHTPVPAGHDRFPSDLIEEHLGPLREGLGLSQRRLMELGRENPEDPGEEFCMTVFGLRFARRANAVSSLHVSRTMWKGLYLGKQEDEVPIGHITNGARALLACAADVSPLRPAFGEWLADTRW